MKKYYSDKIGLHYTFSDGKVIFEDQTEYTSREMKILSGQSEGILQSVHKLKKIFSGEVT